MRTPQHIITFGRACVRLIEAADVLLDYRPVWTEVILLQLVRALYRHRLRSLVATLSPDITAEILAGSEKIGGPVQEFTQN